VASAAIGANVRVTFYDVDPETLAPDMESLTRALGRGPAAVVVTPLYGYQPDWDALRALTERTDATLIEDAAQSFGARWRGRAVGGLGDLSVVSFGRGKGWTAVEGGALLGPERELAPLSTSLPPPPRTRTAARILLTGGLQWGFARPTLYGVPSTVPGLKLGETVFHPPRDPRRIAPLAARLAVETMGAAEAEAEARRTRAKVLAERLREDAPASLRVPRADDRSEPGSIRFPVLASRRARARLLDRGRALGIMPGYPRPLPELPPLLPHIVGREPHEGATALAEALVTLPTHSLLSPGDLSRIFALLRDADG
jgi:dTDP-4-amino-4,6-dideoxygalactose transaminase